MSAEVFAYIFQLLLKSLSKVSWLGKHSWHKLFEKLLTLKMKKTITSVIQFLILPFHLYSAFKDLLSSSRNRHMKKVLPNLLTKSYGFLLPSERLCYFYGKRMKNEDIHLCQDWVWNRNEALNSSQSPNARNLHQTLEINFHQLL